MLAIDTTPGRTARHAPDVPNPALLALRYSAREKRSLHLRSLLTLACMYGVTVAAGRDLRLLPLAFVFNTLALIRYTGYIHALNHAYRTSDPLPWLLSFMPALTTPFVLDFAGFRRVHHAHHILETQPGDPDNFLIDGGNRLWIFFKCSLTFEHWFFFTLRHGWQSKRFWPLFALRLALFAALAWASGPLAFIAGLLVATKLGTAIAFYIFSYRVHVREGRRGIYLLPLDPNLERLSHILIGRNAALPANIHTTHHEKPWIACEQLDEAQRLIGEAREQAERAAAAKAAMPTPAPAPAAPSGAA